MKRLNKATAVFAAGVAVATGAVALAPAAGAAQSQMTLTCSGQQLTVRTNSNNSSDNGGWSVGVVVDSAKGAHLIPTSFSGSATDDTTHTTLFSFSQIKGGGNANRNQQTVTCTSTQHATLAEFLDPGEQPPPGTSPSDQVTFTITVTAVPKP
jgi:hypothetical protein